MVAALRRYGFFFARVNGAPAWTHLEWSGYRIILGKRTLRLEFRSVTQAKVRRNLRGTWRKVETYPIPEGVKARRALVAGIVSTYLGEVSGVRSSAAVGTHARASLRSSAIHRGNVPGGGKVRGMPTRASAFGYSPAAGARLASGPEDRMAMDRAAFNARRGFLGESGACK